MGGGTGMAALAGQHRRPARRGSVVGAVARLRPELCRDRRVDPGRRAGAASGVLGARAHGFISVGPPDGQLGDGGGAGAATAPLLAAYGQGVSWVSLVANVIVAPLVPVVVFGALAAIGLVALGDGVQALGPAPPHGRRPAGACARGRVDPGARSGGDTLGGAPGRDLPGGRAAVAGRCWLGVAAGGLLSAAALLARRWRWLTIALPASIAICSVALARAPTALAGGLPADWQAVFCDVGQGDAALIRSGPSSAVLVDAGPDPAAARECLDRSGVDQLDAVVLSHFHRDHSAGLAAALDVGRPSMCSSPAWLRRRHPMPRSVGCWLATARGRSCHRPVPASPSGGRPGRCSAPAAPSGRTPSRTTTASACWCRSSATWPPLPTC